MTPGDCPNETRFADIGGGKSYCEPWRRWTNCREVGKCVWEEMGTPRDSQMTIFDILEDDSCE